jgi:hypothetical protein
LDAAGWNNRYSSATGAAFVITTIAHLMLSQAIAIESSTVICVHGILAKVVFENIAMKDGSTRPLITITIANGPPKALLTIQFWNPSPGTTELFEQLLHQAVNVTKLRVVADLERGNRYESIGSHTRVASVIDPSLEAWWFKPDSEQPN